MFELIFGSIWLGFSVLISIPFLFAMSSTEGMIFFIVPFFGLFYAIGIIMIVIGAKKVAKNNKTEKFGELTFGKILRIFQSGNYVNGNPELKADIGAVNPNTKMLESFSEVIGFAPAKYRVGEYVLLKLYNNDVNIVERANESSIPINVKDLLDSAFPTPKEKDVKIIDGVKYVKASQFEQSLDEPFEHQYDKDEW